MFHLGYFFITYLFIFGCAGSLLLINLTRDPQGLIDALTLLKTDTTPTSNPTSKGAALYINEPVTRQGKAPFLVKMFDTHPPLDERIARLKRLLGEK